MSAVICKTLVTFLVIYALNEMISKLFKLLLNGDEEKKEIFIFIHVKNQENTIEYVVRCTIFNYLHSYGGRVVPYIVIVDKGSNDRTGEIAEKLCADYEFVYYTTEDEYIEFKNQIDQ